MSKKNCFSIILSLFFLQIGFGQVVSLGCQTEDDATIGLDRKDWEIPSGTTVQHSDGYMMNFALPTNTFGDCKKITEIEITFTINSFDVTNLEPGCSVGQYWTNIYHGCSTFGAATCPTSDIIEDFPNSSPTSQTLVYSCPPHEFLFGETIGVDLIPAAGNLSCPNGQSMVASGQITIDYEVCVEITVGDDQIEIPVNLGPDIDVCENETTNIDAGSAYTDYDWDPNGESSQSITVGSGSYTVTVTDAEGCTDSDQIIINELIPTVTITSSDTDNTVCPGFTVDLTANTSESNIMWSTGETATTITVGPGSYSIEVTDGNSCTGTDEITIDLFPTPSLNITPASASVCDNGTINVQATSGYSNYNWSNGFTSDVVDLPPGSYILTITDSNGCTNTGDVMITNVDSPYAGVSDAISVCNDGQTYDLDFLIGAPQVGGNWTDDDASGLDVNADPFNTSFVGISAGTYDFTYSISATSPCVDQFATLTITVEEAADSGTSNSEVVCSDGSTLDFDFLLGPHDFGGTWIDEDASGVSLSDIFNVNFQGITAGTYEFTYIVTATSPCTDDESTLEITVLEGVDAGADNMISVCEGAVIDLNTALSFGVDLSGTWSDDDGSGALSGSMFNSSNFQGQSFQFTYSLGSGSSCGMDEAIITVSIETSLSAGVNNLGIEECLGDTLDLFDYLPSADLGGVFTDVDGSGGLENNLLITSMISPGTYFYEYQIGDGVTCPEETSTLEFIFYASPDFEITGGNSFCGEGCSTLNLSFSGTSPFVYTYEVYDANGNITELVLNNTNDNAIQLEVCNDGGTGNLSNDTIHIGDSFMEWFIVPSAIGDSNCSVDLENMQDTVFYQISDSFISQVDPMLCPGDSVIVNGTVYNMDNPLGTETVTNPGDCDSTYVVNLSFFPAADNLIDNQLCTGDSLIVNGTIYNESNPTGMEILIGGSQSSCDSTITIDLEFVDNIENFFSESVCIGDSIFLEGQWQFNSGDYTDTFQSAAGCDSIIVTTVLFNSCNVPIDIMVTNNECFDDEEGIITITIDNGNAPYTVDWSGNGQMGSFDITQNFVPESLTDLASTTYMLTITDNLGDIISILPITINNNNPEITGDLVIMQPVDCHDNSTGVLFANINGGGGNFLYEWNPDLGNTSMPSDLSAGFYFLTVTDQFGCEYNLDIELTNPDELFVDFTLSDITCNSAGEILFSDWGGGTSSYSIFVDGVLAVSPSDSPPFSFPIALEGMHEFTLVDNNMCELNQDFEISNQGGMSFDLVAEDSSCNTAQNGSISVTNITGGTMPYTVTINGSLIQNPFLADGLDSGSYEIIVSDIDGCMSMQTIVINEGTLSFDISSVDSACNTAQNGSISVFNILGGTMPYTVTLNGNAVQDPSLIGDLNAGNYEIIVTDANGCSSNQTTQIFEENNTILLDYVLTYTIMEGEAITLDGDFVGNVQSFLWDSSISLSCLDCQNPIANPTSTEAFIITAVDVNGCEQMLQITIEVIPAPEEKDELYVANIFSPDGNGFNDTFDFLIGPDSSITEVDCRIYDRWGELVYEDTVLPGDGNGWNGQLKTKDVLPGVYVYLLSYNTATETSITKQGTVTIIQ